jgi:superoxide dismutase
MFSFTLSAQNRRMNMEEFEKRKMEYVKKEAELTQEEADKYFPLNRELTRRKLELHRNHLEKIEKIKESQDGRMTDEEYRKLLENDVEVRQQQAALDKLYSEKFRSVLSSEKLFKAQQAERVFIQRELASFREKEHEEDDES